MVPLKPQQWFTVVRQIANHLDGATYYVRAVIRNAYTDAIIDTLDLDAKGGQRYTKNWRVPADPSGQGFYISIVTSVYTDSGHTTKSENYGDEENTHLVSNVFLPTTKGGGGSNLDAFMVRRIVSEELDKRPYPQPIEPPEPVMRWDDVLGAVQKVQKAVSAIPTDQVDTSPILDAIRGVQAAVEAKPVTQATDLAPVLSRLDTLTPELQTGIRNILTLLDDAQGRLSADVIKELQQVFQQIEFKIAPSSARMAIPQPQQKPVPFDLSKLAS